jgi:hypothetical protein
MVPHLPGSGLLVAYGRGISDPTHHQRRSSVGESTKPTQASDMGHQLLDQFRGWLVDQLDSGFTLVQALMFVTPPLQGLR